eukprot:RCo017192
MADTFVPRPHCDHVAKVPCSNQEVSLSCGDCEKERIDTQRDRAAELLKEAQSRARDHSRPASVDIPPSHAEYNELVRKLRPFIPDELETEQQVVKKSVNPSLEAAFWASVKKLGNPRRIDTLCFVHLKPQALEKILKDGFDLKRDGSVFQSHHGILLHTTMPIPESGASHIHALICKVAVGQAKYMELKEIDTATIRLLRKSHDSCAQLPDGRYVVFHRSQVLPEVLISSAVRRKALIPGLVPRHWTSGSGLIDVTNEMAPKLLNLIKASSHPVCKGVDGKSCIADLHIKQVLRNQNLTLLSRYRLQQSSILEEKKGHGIPILSIQPGVEHHRFLNRDLNEVYLFHGSNPDTATIIARNGFDERVANLGGLFGAGIYFAQEGCKSAQYCRSKDAHGRFCLLYCRVTLGDIFYTDSTLANMRRPPARKDVPTVLYDSVVANPGVANGGHQVHRELIVYNGAQCLPEYIIYFTY